MNSDQRLENIYEFNLSYLLLARKLLLQEDWPVALYCLGLSDSTARVLSDLSPAAVIRFAETRQLICQLRISEAEDLLSMTRGTRIDGQQSLYNAIMLASKGVNK